MRKRSEKKIYGIIGLGRFGRAVAKGLSDAGDEVLVADRDEARIREAREYTENAFVTSDLSRENLEQMGFGACDTVIICLAEKLDVSLLTALHAVNMGVPRVIAKAVSAEHGALLEKIGAEVVYPERDMGARLSKLLCATSALEYISLADNIDLTEVPVPEKYVGVQVKDCGIRSQFGVNIIALRSGNSTTTSIRPDYTFRSEDALMLIGSPEEIRKFQQEMLREEH